MMKSFTRLLVAAGVLLCLAGPAVAQTTLNSTTLSAAMTANQQAVSLTSTTSVAVNDLLFVDGEFMRVLQITPSIRVRRGAEGSGAGPHASGVVVWTGVRERFYANDVVGTCTATAELYLPHIVYPSGNAYDCASSEWVRMRYNGHRVWQPGRSDGGTTYTANGAITIQPGFSFINGTTLAMTLANPTTEQNGMIMVIISTNASAQTVTYTAGFDGGTTARDLATFGGAVGDNVVIQAFNGVWWVISTRNVTFG